MSLLHVSQSLHLSSTELFHLFFLFTSWGVFSLVWTLLHEPQERGVLTEALAFVKWWAGWAGRVRHPCRGLESGVALMTLGAWVPRWLCASSPPGDKARGLLSGTAHLAPKWRFLKRPWHPTRFSCPGLRREMRLLLPSHFPQRLVVLESCESMSGLTYFGEEHPLHTDRWLAHLFSWVSIQKAIHRFTCIGFLCQTLHPS